MSTTSPPFFAGSSESTNQSGFARMNDLRGFRLEKPRRFLAMNEDVGFVFGLADGGENLIVLRGATKENFQC